jgi:tetratricopeptide (TPR) repeat protein
MKSGSNRRRPLLFALILAATWLPVLGFVSEELPQVPADVIESLPEEARASLAQLTTGLADNPDDPVLIGQIGMLLHAHERLAVAEQYYSRAHALAPEAFEWGYYLAVVQSLQGENSEAIALLQAIILPSDPYVPAQLKLGQMLFEANEWDESAKISREVLGRFPDLAVAHYALGRALNELGETQEAAASFEKACEIYPKYGPAHYAAALAYRQLGDETKAAEHFTLYKENRLTRPGVGDGYLEAIKSLKTGSRLAHQHLARAQELGDKGQLAEAIEENLKALEADSGFLQAHVNLIILYGTTGDTERAAEQYRQAVAINRDYPEAHYNYGVLLLNQEQYLEAKEAFSEVLQINPYHAQAHNNLGQILELEGLLEEALKHYEAACESDRAYRIAQFNRGRVLTALKRFDEAIEAFLKTREPEDEATARYLYALGAAYVRSGDLENGLKYTEEAKAVAERYKQDSLLAAIDRDLERLKRALNR